jgi:hypothetical protein
MNNIEQSKLVEMLKLARASLNEEFLQKQTDAYQEWNNSCNQAWKTRGMLLPPYNVKLVYPNEKDIVDRALEIYNKLSPVIETAPAVQDPTEVISPEVFQAMPTDEVIDTPVVEEVVAPIEEVVEPIEKVVEPIEESKYKSLLTKWGGRGSF